MKTLISFLIFLFSMALQGQNLDRLQSHYQNGRLEQVVEQGIRILEDDPEALVASHLTGRALVDLKRYAEAKAYLEKTSVDPAPAWMQAWSYGYLGVSHFFTDDAQKAKACLQEAVRMNVTANATAFAEKRLTLFQLSPYFDDWEVVETEHIRFHLQPDHGIEKVENYIAVREEAHQRINTFFRAQPIKKVDFFVWSKPEEGKSIIGRNIGFARSSLCLINSRVDQTRGHELTHILSDVGLRPEQKNRLINEGLAVAFDQTKRDRMALARSANVDAVGIEQLMKNADQYPEAVIYPIGGAFIEFLMAQEDEDTLKDLIRDQSWDQLLKLYGKEVIREFEAKISPVTEKD